MAAQAYSIDPTTSKWFATATGAAITFSGLLTTRFYEVTVSTDSYVAQGTVASAGNGSYFVPAGKNILLQGGNGNISVLAVTAAGVATCAVAYLAR